MSAYVSKLIRSFVVQNGFIVPKTKMGKATIYLLEFNLPEKVDIRLVLIKAGFYP